jgi:hypothetical protein
MVEDPFENSQADIISVTDDNVSFWLNTEAEDTIKIKCGRYDLDRCKLTVDTNNVSISVQLTKDDLRKLMAVVREVIEYEDKD